MEGKWPHGSRARKERSACVCARQKLLFLVPLGQLERWANQNGGPRTSWEKREGGLDLGSCVSGTVRSGCLQGSFRKREYHCEAVRGLRSPPEADAEDSSGSGFLGRQSQGRGEGSEG